jgi:homoserine O-acetyltransferase
MNAGQAATQFSELMEIAVPFCGSAMTSLHNQVYLEGVNVCFTCCQEIFYGRLIQGLYSP